MATNMTSIFTWGRPTEGQLGRKGETAVPTWPRKLPHDKQWRTVAAAYTRSAAISCAILSERGEPFEFNRVPLLSFPTSPPRS